MRSKSASVAIDGDEVCRLRKLAGFSQAGLAAKALISPPYVSQIEAGGKTVSPPVFARICDALGIAPEDRAQLAREQLGRPPRQRRRPPEHPQPREPTVQAVA